MTPDAIHRYALLPRPADQIHNYPLDVRWEITRRHPYYQLFWEDAQRYRRNELSADPAKRMKGLTAAKVLWEIGVTGEPVDPATDGKALLGAMVDPYFLAGSVQPVTFRAMAYTLIKQLPPDELYAVTAMLAVMMHKSSAIEGDDSWLNLRRDSGILALDRINSLALDSFPTKPLFFLHLGASSRTIVEDIKQLAPRLKRHLNLPSAKVQTAKLRDHLKVWDMRLGWAREAYDVAKQKSFRAIARALHLKVETVVHRYKAAFKLVSGHDLTRDHWFRLFGPLLDHVCLGRHQKVRAAPVRGRPGSKGPRLVPDTVISPGPDAGRTAGVLDGRADPTNRLDVLELCEELERIIARGGSDAELAMRVYGRPDPQVGALIRSILADFRESAL